MSAARSLQRAADYLSAEFEALREELACRADNKRVHIECQTAAADDKVGKVTTLVGPRKVNAGSDAATNAISFMASPWCEAYLIMWGGQLNVILEVGD